MPYQWPSDVRVFHSLGAVTSNRTTLLLLRTYSGCSSSPVRPALKFWRNIEKTCGEKRKKKYLCSVNTLFALVTRRMESVSKYKYRNWFRKVILGSRSEQNFYNVRGEKVQVIKLRFRMNWGLMVGRDGCCRFQKLRNFGRIFETPGRIRLNWKRWKLTHRIVSFIPARISFVTHFHVDVWRATCWGRRGWRGLLPDVDVSSKQPSIEWLQRAVRRRHVRRLRLLRFCLL